MQMVTLKNEVPLLEVIVRKGSTKWWKRLANEKGYRGKHFDWSHLAVAHDCFWRYHPARAYIQMGATPPG